MTRRNAGLIALLSLASVLMGPAIKGALIVAAIGTFVLMFRIDRGASVALLPSDAFSLRSETGAGLWMVWLLSIAYSPLAIYAPLFLQRLHALSPLTAGYMVAGASLAWTAAALTVASLSAVRTVPEYHRTRSDTGSRSKTERCR